VSDLVCLSHLRWEFASHLPQQILPQSKQNRVLFLEEPIGSLSATRPYLEVFREDHHGTPNVTVVRLILPVGKNRRITHNDPQALRSYTRLLSKFLQAENYRNPIVWLDTPTAFPVAEIIDHKLMIFDAPDFQQYAESTNKEAMTSAV
jgi:hypothetical protein